MSTLFTNELGIMPAGKWLVYYRTKTSAGEFTALQTTANIDNVIYYEKINFEFAIYSKGWR